MSGEGEVRSRELKMGLSSSEDHEALEVTSPSTLHKAWGIHCSLKEKDEKRIRDRFQFSSSITIRILNGDNKACHSYADEVCFYEANFVNGLPSTCPRLKKRYHGRVEKVGEYLEKVKDFDELISPQSLFLHFLNPEPSNHVWKKVKIVKKKMTTKFNKAKLAEIQENEAKGGLTGGLLTRKRQREMEIPKDDPMMTSLVTKSVAQHLASPTSSLELIASTNYGSKAKGKDKGPPSSLWDDAGVAVLKAHKAILVEELSPLGVKPSHDLMSSHVHKVMQVLGDSLYISGKYLDHEEKYVMAKSKVESLSAENESLKSQIFTLADEAKNEKEHLKTLKKSIHTEKAFSKLKDKQIDEALLKVKKAGSEVVEKLKASDEYLDKLCDYYVEGFDLFR
ncbi:hypothetical protein SO802_009962 [Lithocarpus litseifolius]|uniref:Uncharacterized protein n=1 Tax=Lithocarpus litseifolius TaxID=425828 RepID=A0AAW2DCX7_9ROSI